MGPEDNEEPDSNFDLVLKELINDLYKDHKPINIDDFLTKDEDKIEDFGIF